VENSAIVSHIPAPPDCGEPLKPGDDMTVTLTCKQISPRAGDYGEVRWDAEVTNQDGTVVATYDVLTMVAKEWNA
jgi:oxepin-CoA hydrolase / 3-oxo-5,6-dehydrosuberyl-CoA semialdehyde dehydrogenase